MNASACIYAGKQISVHAVCRERKKKCVLSHTDIQFTQQKYAEKPQLHPNWIFKPWCSCLVHIGGSCRMQSVWFQDLQGSVLHTAWCLHNSKEACHSMTNMDLLHILFIKSGMLIYRCWSESVCQSFSEKSVIMTGWMFVVINKVKWLSETTVFNCTFLHNTDMYPLVVLRHLEDELNSCRKIILHCVVK